MEGSLLGVFEADFPVQTHQLRSGDKVLFYTDGIDAARFDDHAPGNDSFLAWATENRSLPIRPFVQQLAKGSSSSKGRRRTI